MINFTILYALFAWLGFVLLGLPSLLLLLMQPYAFGVQFAEYRRQQRVARRVWLATRTELTDGKAWADRLPNTYRLPHHYRYNDFVPATKPVLHAHVNA